MLADTLLLAGWQMPQLDCFVEGTEPVNLTRSLNILTSSLNSHGFARNSMQPASQSSFLLNLGSVCGHRHDRNSLSLRMCMDRASCVEAVHLRHIEIHKDKSRPRCEREINCFTAII